jgi:formate hydrogenlyase subunit 3/multisubunit Na+/H+ antiporter MnhD subunit
MIMGVLYLLYSKREMKRIIAYSSVVKWGIYFLSIGFGQIGVLQ